MTHNTYTIVLVGGPHDDWCLEVTLLGARLEFAPGWIPEPGEYVLSGDPLQRPKDQAAPVPYRWVAATESDEDTTT